MLKATSINFVSISRAFKCIYMYCNSNGKRLGHVYEKINLSFMKLKVLKCVVIFDDERFRLDDDFDLEMGIRTVRLKYVLVVF
uniref:PRC-barrel domain-containing protein n=1 Tax=Parascaris univalens TaxID=6257 RepID=A0A914ZNH9_PARUN